MKDGSILTIKLARMCKLTQLFLFIFCSFYSNLIAQQEVNYALYRYHLNLINPAVVGTQGAAFLNFGIRNQWLGVADAPRSLNFTYSTPQKNERVGIGFNLSNDKTFVEQQTQLFFDFSYRLPLEDEHSVYLGIKGGGTGFRLNAHDLAVYQSTLEDPNLLNVSSFVPNIGIGIIYHTPRFYIGFSIPRMLSTDRFHQENGQETQPSDHPHYYFNTGFRFNITDRFEFTPAAMLSWINLASSMYVLDASFSYNKIFDFGVQYIQRGGLGGTLMTNFDNAFQVGYAYITQSGKQVNFFSQPTHEVLLRIRVGSLKEQQDFKERYIGTKNKGIRSGLRY